MNRSFTKLFSSIVTSTIWREDNIIRIVWITLLALADQFGEVAGSIPGLAAMANVSIDECERALQKLMSPDPYSRTPDHGGRRIEAIEGGWRLLNHGRYRDMRDAEERREYQREWDREHRPSGHKRTKRSDNSPTKSDKSDRVRPIQKQKHIQSIKRPTVSLSKESFRLARLLLDLIRGRKPDFKPNVNVNPWAKDISQMIYLDSRSPERIEAVLRWCQADPFWQNNILSGKKLREQFDQLELKMRGKGMGRTENAPETTAPVSRDADGLTPRERIERLEGIK